jgi:hypothetical protein
VRRAIAVFLLAVGLFALAALGGFYAAARLAPDRLRAEAETRLSALLRAPVRLAGVRVSLTEDLPWLHLEATGLRADPLPGGSSLAIERLGARIDPFLLILGRLELRGLELRGVDATMPKPQRDPKAASPQDPATRAVAALTAAAEQLRAKPCPIPPLDAERLSLSLTSARAPRRVLELDRVSFRCARIRGVGAWDVAGRVPLPDGAGAPFSGELAASENEVEASVSAASTPISQLMAALGQPPGLAGELSGELHWRAAPGEAHELHVEVAGREVVGRAGSVDAARAVRLDLAAPRLVLSLRASERALETSRFELSDGSLSASGGLRVGLPLGDASGLRADLALADVDRADLARVARQLPQRLRTNFDRALERSVRGRVPKLTLALNSDVKRLRAMLAGDFFAHASDVKLSLSVEDAELRVGKADRLRDVTATLELAGDTLELHALEARFRERRLPRLSARVVGIQHLESLDDLRCERPPAAPRLDGIDDLRAWVESRRKPPYTPSWTKLALDVDYVSHATLFCTLEDVVALVERDAANYAITIERGRWAGFGVSGRAQYLRSVGKDGLPVRDGGSVSLDLALGKREPSGAPRATDATWAEGRFDLAVQTMGRFLTRRYDGSFRATGSEVLLYDSRIELEPSGVLEGNISMQLGAHGPLPFRAEAQSRGLDLLDLWKTSQLEKPVMSGTLVGGATLRGNLHHGQHPLLDVSGYGSLHARDGEIYRSVPFLLALAMSDEKINPFGKRDRFPYRAIDLEGPAENGWLFSRTLTLEGPSERMAASGKTHLSDPYELESVIGMYPIPTLDSIVAAIPIVNVLLLGDDRALAGFYFAVTGDWTKPSVAALPIKSIASGPASLVLEGVPNFVLGGLRALGSVLTPPAAPAKKPAEPPLATAPEGVPPS